MLQEDNILVNQKNSIVGSSLEVEVLIWTYTLEPQDQDGLQKEIKWVHGMFNAGVAQLVERQPSKLNVVGSSPITRSTFFQCNSL